jgi:hypothetical protein
MSGRRRLLFGVVSSCVVSAFPRFVAADEPVLVKVNLHTHTKDDDRDHDTGIFVQVTKIDGHTSIAQIGDAESCCGQYGYADNEDHDLPIPIYKAQQFKKSECVGFKFRMGIMARGGILGNASFTGKIEDWPVVSVQGGNDKWKFDAWLRLTFSDGSFLENNKINQTLESNGGRLAWDGLN